MSALAEFTFSLRGLKLRRTECSRGFRCAQFSDTCRFFLREVPVGVEQSIVGRQCNVLVSAHQTILRGVFRLRPGELATCEMILTDVISGKQQWAVLNWNRIDVGACSVGVDVEDVRVFDLFAKVAEVQP